MKKIKTLLAIGLAAVLTAGCTATDTPFGPILNDPEEDNTAASEAAELTFWVDAADQGTFETALNAFNATQDLVNVTCTFYKRDELSVALKEAAEKGELPSMWATSPGPDSRSYTENGLTYDLTQFAMERDWASLFRPSALKMVTMNDSIAGYPTSLSAFGVYYNKSLFAQKGLKVPETFEELENICAVLKTSGIVPFALAGKSSQQTSYFLECLIEYYAGSASHDRMLALKSSWNNDAVIQAAAIYQEFAELGFFESKFNDRKTGKVYELLRTHKAAMSIFDQGGDNFLTDHGVNPDEFGWFPFPSVEGRVAATGDMVQLSAALTENEVSAAISFLDYYMNTLVSYDNSYFTDPIQGHSIQGNQPNTANVLAAADERGIFTMFATALPSDNKSLYKDIIRALTEESLEPGKAAARLAEAFG